MNDETDGAAAAVVFAPTPIDQSDTIRGYLSSLTSPIDSFVEERIAASRTHDILSDGHEAGAFGLLQDGALAFFHLRAGSRRRAGTIFARVLSEYGVRSAVVPTCDEFLLSLSIDHAASWRRQAFLFSPDGPIPREPPGAQLTYRPARVDELATIIGLGGDFVDRPEERLAAGTVHIGFLDGGPAAIGLVEPSRYWPGRASIGMFTHPDLRRRGFATRTLLHLRRICEDDKILPVAGCWQGNLGSRRALEAAGLFPHARLVAFTFLP